MGWSGSAGSKEKGNNWYAGIEGPSGGLGYSKDGDTHRLDAQANAGGWYGGHKNENHDFRASKSVGWGWGGRVHGGEMPGFGFDTPAGGLDIRSKAFNKPVSKDTEDFLRNGGMSF